MQAQFQRPYGICKGRQILKDACFDCIGSSANSDGSSYVQEEADACAAASWNVSFPQLSSSVLRHPLSELLTGSMVCITHGQHHTWTASQISNWLVLSS
jgi:hypothetical protein